MEWLNTRDIYVQYCPKGGEDPVLLELIRKFGLMFDEKYWYWITKKTGYLRRAPLWLYPRRSTPQEKHRAPEQFSFPELVRKIKNHSKVFA